MSEQEPQSTDRTELRRAAEASLHSMIKLVHAGENGSTGFPLENGQMGRVERIGDSYVLERLDEDRTVIDTKTVSIKPTIDTKA
jgi:hypothetical protein